MYRKRIGPAIRDTKSRGYTLEQNAGGAQNLTIKKANGVETKNA